MKKILLGLLSFMMIFTFSGCGKKVTLDLDKIKDDLQNLETDKFSFQDIQSYAEDKAHMYSDDIYDTKEEFGLTYDHFETILARRDNETNHRYIVILPNEGKKDEIKQKMKEYLDKETVLKTASDEYEGYLIYAIDNEPKETIKRIKSARGKVFASLMEIPKSDLESFMDVKESWVSESLVMTPMMIVNSNLYIIIKPNKDNYQDVKNAIEDYLVKKEEEWKTYLPAQYELVKNRKFEKVGDYLVYVVSTDNDLVLKRITERKK